MCVLSKLPVMLSDIDDVDIRYENGCIYMIKNKTDDAKHFYIGSTYNFKQRCKMHKINCYNQNDKNYNLKVYKYIRENGGFGEWEIILLYDYPCKNRNKLELEEKRAIMEYKSTLNKNIPCRTKKEYYQDNKEKILQQNKELYEANKEEILQKNRMKINCNICNRLVRKHAMERHKRTQICKKLST